AYKSIVESFIHAGAETECKVRIKYIAADNIKAENAADKLEGLHGILVAPGFGERGIEGKIVAVTYARENQVPFFGICLGMQCAIVEFARNVLELRDANSMEVEENTPNPVIHLMEDQQDEEHLGGTMRLGAFECTLKKGTKAASVYGKTKISERHRHRYEFNNKYKKQFEDAGMVASGINQERDLVEIVELKKHPFFIATQFHPELKSTVANPHPLFIGFIRAAMEHDKRNI